MPQQGILDEMSALISGTEGVLSYRQYCQVILRTRDTLRALDLKKGDMLAILAPSSLEYIILLMAIWDLGLIAVPISGRWPAQQISTNLEKIGCRQIVVFRQMSNSIDSLKFSRVFILEDLDIMHLSNQIHDCKIEAGTAWAESDCHDTLEGSHHPCLGAVMTEWAEPCRHATVLFTSGSSGDQKAVVHTLKNHIYSALGANQNIPFLPDDRWLLCLPLYHVGGMAVLFRAALGGGCVVVPGIKTPIEVSIADNKITHISLVATQLYRLLQNKSVIKQLRDMKAILLGGGAIPEKLIKHAAGNGLPVHISYGSTEMASQITSTCKGDPESRLFTSGKPLPYRQLCIAGDGEILVKGPTLFAGYLESGKIVNDLDEDGWFHTGDLGYLDDEGYLKVTGRKDNMFISGGENIQPEEIERIILMLPDVERALVAPVDDEEFGKRPAAFVKLNGKKPIDSVRIKQHLQKHIARFKVPDHFFAWPETENSRGIKPDRRFFASLARDYIQRQYNC